MNEYILLVLHKKGRSLSAFSLLDNSMIFDIRTNVFPHEICLSPDRKLAYLTEYGLPVVESEGTGGNTIAVVDIAKRKIIKRISTGNFRRPHGIVTHKNGQMWVTAEYNEKILSFDISTEELRFSVTTVGKTPHIVTITPDGKQAISTHVFTGDIIEIFEKNTRIKRWKNFICSQSQKQRYSSCRYSFRKYYEKNPNRQWACSSCSYAKRR